MPDTDGVYLVPAFVGLGAPYWDPRARGVIVGLTRNTQMAHIARAAVEAMAYQTTDVLEAMQAESQLPLTTLKVDGGAAANAMLLQFQADLLNVTVRRPVVAETTALGAAYLAGLAVGYWNGFDDVTKNWALDREFQPGDGRGEARPLVCGLEEGGRSIARLGRLTKYLLGCKWEACLGAKARSTLSSSRSVLVLCHHSHRRAHPGMEAALEALDALAISGDRVTVTGLEPKVLRALRRPAACRR